MDTNWMSLRRVSLFFLLSLCSVGVCALPKAAVYSIEIADNVGEANEPIIEKLNLGDRLSKALIDSRSFSLLTRDRDEQLILQLESELAASSISAETDANFNASISTYLIHPRVTRFYAKRGYVPIDIAPGFYQTVDRGELHLAISVFDRQGTILFSSSAHASFNEEVGSPVDKKSARGVAFSRLSNVADTVVEDLLNQIISKVNPITVLDIQGPSIILDRGAGSGFKVGQVLKVYGLEKSIPHPRRPNDVITIPGAYCCEIKISAIYPDIAEARLVKSPQSSSTEQATIQAGYILRVQ